MVVGGGGVRGGSGFVVGGVRWSVVGGSRVWW